MSRSLALGLLVIALLATVVAAVRFGVEPIDLWRAVREPDSLDATILWSARLPRVLLACLAGGALSVVGVAFQALLRNPWADPYVLGVSGGAAAGATLAIVAGTSAFSILGAAIVPEAAMAGGLIATFLVYAIARAGGEVSGTTIVLAGVIVNAIAASVITFVKTLVSASKAQELLFWLMGFLDVPSTPQLVACTVWVTVGLIPIVLDSGRLNLLALGREPAGHLGIDVPRLERRVFFAASAIAGAVVSLTGLIGFVGLVVPHAVRRLLGPDHRIVVPASLLLGATTLTACDLLTRALFRWLETEPPVGAVTALIGGPLFLVILLRGRRHALE
ncbi:MAG: iron ABC transporter permease [Polyangiaceae bacterium]|nr:iron ABC transporter permease [Polyangiaceae bacterium]